MIYVVNVRHDESQLKHWFLLWTVRVVTVLDFLISFYFYLLFVSTVDLLISVQFLLTSVYLFISLNFSILIWQV